MSDRPGQLEIRDESGVTLGYATVLVATGAEVVNGVATIPGVSAGEFDALSYKGASAPSATEFNYLAGVTSGIQSQINGKEPAFAAGTTAQYRRGDKTWQTLDTTAVPEGTNLYFTNSRADARVAAAIGVTVQAWDADLDSLAALSATAGLLSRTGAGAFAARTLTAPATGITITNPTGSGGNPTFALANDLAALEGLSSTGFAVRTASDVWAQRSVVVTASTGLSVTNGDGVSGNPTLAGLDASTTIKGVASFNSTNFSVTSGAVNTVQNIHTGASPTFVNLTLTGNLSAVGVASSLIPSVTDAYDLGSATKLWRKGWLSEMDAVLFAKNTVTLIGGWLLVTKNEGAIPVGQDVGSSDTTIDFGQTMTANDFILFRAAGAVEYVQVGTLVSGTRYNVTRNLDGSGANAWPAGSVYAVLGNTGSGRIELNANDTPRISLIRQGSTYNSQTELVRVGDLNGNWGYSSETYGFVAGEYAAGKAWVAVDPTNGLRIGLHTIINGQWDTSGSLALGQVATNSGNAFWNNSNKRFEFRGGTNGTVVQAYVDTTGAVVGGSGNAILDTNGITVLAGSTFDATKAYRLATPAGTLLGAFYCEDLTTGHIIHLRAEREGSRYANIHLRAFGGEGAPGAVSAIALSTYQRSGGIDLQGASIEVSYAFGLSFSGTADFDSGTLYVDAGNNRVAVGTTSPGANKFSVVAGALADQTRAFYISATMPGTGATAFNTMVTMTATSVNTNQNVYTYNLELLAGGTSAVFYGAARYANQVAGTGAGMLDSSSLAGNVGVFGHASGSTATGHNVGVFGLANNSSALNFGGLFGTLSNVGSALAATNYSTTADIFRAYDGTTQVFTIQDTGVVKLSDITAPGSNPTGGHYLYAESGALKGRGSSGTVTTIAAAEPHCPTCGRDFVLEWQNDSYGHLLLCMWCVTEGFTRGIIERRPAGVYNG